MMVKFIRNNGFLVVCNNLSETLIFSKDESLGPVDLRSIRCYKVKHSTIQDHLQHCYETEPITSVMWV